MPRRSQLWAMPSHISTRTKSRLFTRMGYRDYNCRAVQMDGSLYLNLRRWSNRASDPLARIKATELQGSLCLQVVSIRRTIAAYSTTGIYFSSDGISSGCFATFTPAASNALILSAAEPAPPSMIAPAWPIRFPGGAVAPAMNETTGFDILDAIYSAALSSSVPPISP